MLREKNDTIGMSEKGFWGRTHFSLFIKFNIFFSYLSKKGKMSPSPKSLFAHPQRLKEET